MKKVYVLVSKDAPLSKEYLLNMVFENDFYVDLSDAESCCEKGLVLVELEIDIKSANVFEKIKVPYKFKAEKKTTNSKKKVK